MRSKIKTGDVFQIKKNGTNYVTLGKVVGPDGIELVTATKNGNIGPDGKLKLGHQHPTQPNKRVKPKIHVLVPSSVKKVHSNRRVDMESVIATGGTLVRSHLQRTTASNGVTIQAPNIIAQLADLKASL